jgi:hypothetical protein
VLALEYLPVLVLAWVSPMGVWAWVIPVEEWDWGWE